MSKRPSRPGSKKTPSTVPKTPRNDQPELDENIPTRSQSEFPTLTESMQQLGLESGKKGASSEARSQTTRPSYQRRMLYSAVPDSAVLTPIRRPKDYGKVGRPIEIYTNHFKVSLADALVNQYDIEISMIRRDGKAASARKEERSKVLEELVKREKNFPFVWFDDGKSLYSKALLSDFTEPRYVTLTINEEEKQFEFKVINLVRQEKIRDIFEFLNGNTPIKPRDPIRVIETLFKQNLRKDYVDIKNKFYSRQQQFTDLGDGRGLANGFHQALCLTKSGPTLNINLAFTCFYLPLNLVDFSCKYLRKDIRKRVTPIELEGIRKLFRNLPIETTHAGRPLRYRIKGFGQSARELTISVRADPNTQSESSETNITVEQYFAKKYGPLRYPHLPCVDARKANQNEIHWLPMEVVKVVEWERALGALDSVQRALVSKQSIVKPDRRYDQIMKIVGQRNFNYDKYLKELSVKIDENEMLKINARILPPPMVKYRGQGNNEVAENVAVGKWAIRNRFYASPIINNWGIMYFGPKPDNQVINILQEFQRELPILMGQVGIQFQSKPNTMPKPPREDEIEKAIQTAVKDGWQIAFVILNDVPSAVYDHVKKMGNQKFGLVTQCVNFQSIAKNSGKLKMYMQNLSQKVNAKIGGINGVVNLKAALNHSSNEDLFMFLGADITHTTTSIELPSIAAIVGSRDPTCTRYAARLCEQYPPKNRCAVEIIKDLDKMVIDLLKVFSRACGNRLPNRLVFYRDGVDDGQFQKVLDNEVAKLKNACRAVYGNNPLPRITFIVVKRRHHTRFFAYDGQYTNNIEAGTVIDQGITHPSQFDFYLCSQGSLIGTARPALYHVLHDENGFSSDDIQQLTYWLCHTDARCTKSVSVPAPVHYADLAAYAGRMFDFKNANDQQDIESDDEAEKTPQFSLDDIQTRVMILNDKVQNDMWFV